MTKAKKKKSKRGNMEIDIVLKNITARIDDLDDRLEKDRNSMVRKLGAWGGIIALIVTTIVGGLEIYSRTVTSAKAKTESKLETVSEVSSKIKAYDAELSMLQSSGNYQVFYTRAQAVGTDSLSLLGRIDNIEDTVLKRADASDLMVISKSYIQQGQIEKAVKLGNYALENSNTPLLRGESRRFIAMADFANTALQDQVKARTLMKEALSDFDDIESFQEVGAKQNLRQIWSKIEVQLNNCDEAAIIIDEYLDVAELDAKQKKVEFDRAKFRSLWSYNNCTF